MPTKHMTLQKHRFLQKKQDVDMTEGNIIRHIILFAIPLLIGNLFQQLYNTVDTWVVGNYVSNEAFSAVGAVAPIINMLIGAFMGLASGSGVVISQYYGAKQYDKVNEAVHTAMLMTIILCVIFTAAGLLLTPIMLGILNLHENACDEAITYLTIYFSGVTGLMLYNIGAGILRAVGDSKRPFYYLVVCALTNTFLDLLFVLYFNMGVDGVAWATVISQLLSAVLVIITLIRSDSCIKVTFKNLRINFTILKKILLVGIPAALQMAITAFSNVFVQSYITYFDAGSPAPDYMSGWTAYLKIDQLLFLPMQSIALACTTFVGQNLGKGLLERAKKGVTAAMLISLAATGIIMIPIMIFAPQIVGFLNSKPEVIQHGTQFLLVLTPFSILCCFNQIYASALRGAGNSRAAMIIMLISYVFFRQIYLFFMAKICNEIIPISLGYPAGWLICSIITSIYYHNIRLDKNRLIDDPGNQQ